LAGARKIEVARGSEAEASRLEDGGLRAHADPTEANTRPFVEVDRHPPVLQRREGKGANLDNAASDPVFQILGAAPEPDAAKPIRGHELRTTGNDNDDRDRDVDLDAPRHTIAQRELGSSYSRSHRRSGLGDRRLRPAAHHGIGYLELVVDGAEGVVE